MGRPKKKQTKLIIDEEKLRNFYMNPPYPPKKIDSTVSMDSFKRFVQTKEFKKFSQTQREKVSRFGSSDNMMMIVQLNAMGYCGTFDGAVCVERNEFECNFTDMQIQVLTTLLNAHILNQTVSEQDVKILFYNPCQLKKSLRVTSNRLLIYLFAHLSERNFIASDWQNIIDKYKLFASSRGKILSRKDISRAKATFMGGEEQLNPYPKGYEYVDEVIKMISHKP